MYNMYPPFMHYHPPLPSSMPPPLPSHVPPPPFLPPGAEPNPALPFPAPASLLPMRPLAMSPLPLRHPLPHRPNQPPASSNPASLSIAARAAARYHVEPRARPKQFLVNVRYEDAPPQHLLVRGGGVHVAVALLRRALRAWLPLRAAFPELATPDLRLRDAVEASSETGLDVVTIALQDRLELVWSPHRAVNVLVFVLAAPLPGARRLRVGGIGFDHHPPGGGAGRAWWLPPRVDDERLFLPPSPGAAGGRSRVSFNEEPVVHSLVEDWDSMSLADEQASAERIASVEAVLPSTPDEAMRKQDMLRGLRREHAMRSPRERQLRDSMDQQISPGSSGGGGSVCVAPSPALPQPQRRFMGGRLGGSAMYQLYAAPLRSPYGLPRVHSFAPIRPMPFR